MAHKLSSMEIRRLYELLYKYECNLKKIEMKSLITVDGLSEYLQANDIYVNTINKEHINESQKHQGFFLYGQAEKEDWIYKLIHHIRNAFAHGYVTFNKSTDRIIFKDGEKKIKGELPKALLVNFIELLHSAYKNN